LISLPVDRAEHSDTLRSSATVRRLYFLCAQRNHWDFLPSRTTIGRRESDAGTQSARGQCGRRISNAKSQNVAEEKKEIADAHAKIDSEEEKDAGRRLGSIVNSE